MKQFEKIVEKIARENSAAPDEVMAEMQRAIDLACDRQSAGSAPLWAGMIFRGERPAPEELVLSLAALLQQEGSPAR